MTRKKPPKRGRPRKKGALTEILYARVSPELRRRVIAAAERAGLDISELIRLAAEEIASGWLPSKARGEVGRAP